MKAVVESQKSYKYLVFLAMVYTTVILTGAALMNRLSVFHGLLFDAGELIFPTNFIILDIITEVYGYENSRKLIWSVLPCSFLFTAFIGYANTLPSTNYWHNQEAYNLVFGQSLIVDFMCTVITVVSLFVNASLLSRWKILTKGRYFWLRSLGSSGIGETLQITVTSLVAFFLIPYNHDVTNIIKSVVIYQFSFSFLISMPGVLVMRWLKKAENIDSSSRVSNPFFSDKFSK